MLDPSFIILAIVLRLMAGANYFWLTVRRKTRPSLVSWLFWGLTPLIALAAQLSRGASSQTLITLTLSAGPLAVFAAAVVRGERNLAFTRVDKISAGLAVAGIALWLATSQPMMALLFSLVADYCSGVPTIVKSYRDPDSERALPYFLSMLSMAVTLLTIRQWDAAHYALPVYMLGTNFIFFTLVSTRIGLRRQRAALPAPVAVLAD